MKKRAIRAKLATPSAHNQHNPSDPGDPGRHVAIRMHHIQPSLTLAITAQAAAMANRTWVPANT